MFYEGEPAVKKNAVSLEDTVLLCYTIFLSTTRNGEYLHLQMVISRTSKLFM